MARHSSRLLRLVHWQYTRWGLVFPTFLVALWACNSHELQVPKPNPQQESDFSILVSPERKVDILFMIDNSASMDPKQRALAENFPKMIDKLKELPDGLPDIHVGVISSDMGAGGGEAGGNCSGVLGNRGILWGNDPDADPRVEQDTPRNTYATVKNLTNSAGALGCGMNSRARWIEDSFENDGVTRKRNYTGDLADVFSCLAKGMGTYGCGYEHQLQSVRVALNPQVGDKNDPNNPPINPQNVGFLRQKAYLAVVLISDEDDCSAEPNSNSNDGMFSQYPPPLRETASLRCAARGHVCNGKEIPNYTRDKGYTASEPFVANFADCEAKDDPDHSKLPLIRIRDMIDWVNQVKDRPQDQIVVSGVIGWPKDGKTEGLEYRIDKDKTSEPPLQKDLWDYMPFCTLPNEVSPIDHNIYKAYGAYRLKKFIDAFQDPQHPNTGVYSICDIANFPEAMQKIGNAIATKLSPGCVEFPLIDSNPDMPEVQPECKVKDEIPCDSPGKGDCLSTGYQEQGLSECKVPGTNEPLDPKNPDKKKIPDEARPCWYLAYDNTETGCPKAFKNQRISALRKGDNPAPPGTLLQMQCLTCASPPTPEGESSCPPVGTM